MTRQFRCFDERTLSTDGRVVIIEGKNGSGKSSILEALHYACYLRSFRTYNSRDLIQIGKDHFFAHVQFLNEQLNVTDDINIGYSPADGKIVKYNQKVIGSYKELLDHYKIVTLSAEDIELVHGSPTLRRDFLSYALLLENPVLVNQFKRYKQILEQRNSLIAQQRHGALLANKEFEIWSQKQWEAAAECREYFVAYLTALETTVNDLLQRYFYDESDKDLCVKFVYDAKNMISGDFDVFWSYYSDKHVQTEQTLGRSAFGIHLDDFTIMFYNKRARTYASRGQQKLLALLIKIAQLQQASARGEAGVLLMDDFMTDFDPSRVAQSFSALKDLQFQLFLSTPISPEPFLKHLSSQDVCHIKI